LGQPSVRKREGGRSTGFLRKVKCIVGRSKHGSGEEVLIYCLLVALEQGEGPVSLSLESGKKRRA